MSEPRSVQIFIPKEVDETRFLGLLYKAASEILLQETGSSPFSTTEEERDLEAPLVEARSTAYSGDALGANVGRFVRDITLNARRLLRAIAASAVHGEGISSTKLRERLNAENDGTLGGWAASIGFAVKRLRLPKPYSREYDYLDGGWEPVYRMDPDVARTVLELVDEDGDVLER